MEDFRNTPPKRAGLFSPVNNWRSLKIARRGIILGACMALIKAFLYDIHNAFFLIPILMVWFGILYSFALSSQEDQG